MAEAIIPNSKPAHAPSDNDNNPSKFFRHFLYKAVLVTVFLVLLPIFPSIAPEFINQTLHARSWELLQLICVGIAVSYGLFSNKNDEAEKDNNYGSKFDNAQSYVSKLLQVSSVFDDESENNQTVIDDNKAQTWSSQYYRGEPPVVVVAKEKGDENSVVSKPLLLPVRSLKQQANEGNDYESGVKNRVVSRRSVRNSRRLRNEDVVDDKVEDNTVVLPSPIPWRSRSGRMEMKENGNDIALPLTEEQELSRIESRSFKSNSGAKNLSPLLAAASGQKMAPPMAFLSEPQDESDEEVVRKKGFPPPPAPPPPPASAYVRRPVLVKSNSSVVSNLVPEKALSRSVRSVPMEELREAEMEEPVRMNPGTELRGRDIGKSVRTFRANEMVFESDKKSSKDYEAVKGYSDAKLKNELIEKVMVESSGDGEDSESDDKVVDRVEGNTGNEEAVDDDIGVNELGPDVDKKADEFIAKFREQIRLQRIESIRKSTVQRTGRTFR